MFDNINNSLPHIKSGKLRALAVTVQYVRSAARDSHARGVRFPRLQHPIVGWRVRPGRTAQAGVDRLNTAINDALRDKQLRELLASEGIEVQGDTPEEFHAFLRA
jgi:tripartite-type tricarboxylate transporter receptor subunit TctC